jgi:hypothetical protein
MSLPHDGLTFNELPEFGPYRRRFFYLCERDTSKHILRFLLRLERLRQPDELATVVFDLVHMAFRILEGKFGRRDARHTMRCLPQVVKDFGQADVRTDFWKKNLNSRGFERDSVGLSCPHKHRWKD